MKGNLTGKQREAKPKQLGDAHSRSLPFLSNLLFLSNLSFLAVVGGWAALSCSHMFLYHISVYVIQCACLGCGRCQSWPCVGNRIWSQRRHSVCSEGPSPSGRVPCGCQDLLRMGFGLLTKWSPYYKYFKWVLHNKLTGVFLLKPVSSPCSLNNGRTEPLQTFHAGICASCFPGYLLLVSFPFHLLSVPSAHKWATD